MPGRVSLVAHRGQPLSFPENSLIGFRHVLDAGANNLELDVQITADGIPVLSHDANLLKLTGKQIVVTDHAFEVIADIPAGFRDRFGDQFEDHRIESLESFVQLMSNWPDVRCFIELKEASINYFRNKAVDLVYDIIQPIESQSILISFDYDALVYARDEYQLDIGWVLSEWDEDSREKAQELKPDFLFVETDLCPDDQADIWDGRWQWVIYTVNDADGIKQYTNLGFELIETNRYSELIEECDIIDVSNDF